MRLSLAQLILVMMTLSFFSGCALGKKEWPDPQEREDRFALELLVGERQEACLHLEIAVSGAISRMYRASIQYEVVGGSDGEGCTGCPFVPRDVAHFTRGQQGFSLNGNNLILDFCDLDPSKQYRFRVAGKSELPTSPLVYTDVYITTP